MNFIYYIGYMGAAVALVFASKYILNICLCLCVYDKIILF